jgi:hypothetical protein
VFAAFDVAVVATLCRVFELEGGVLDGARASLGERPNTLVEPFEEPLFPFTDSHF